MQEGGLRSPAHPDFYSTDYEISKFNLNQAAGDQVVLGGLKKKTLSYGLCCPTFVQPARSLFKVDSWNSVSGNIDN
jgi:hypothetical protein